MKKNFGFTLAEVLITLGIIGVVAALTAPALVKNSGQAKIGPSLAKFVNTWETACEQMMYEEEISKLSSIASNMSVSPDILEHLSKYIVMTKLPQTTTYTVHALHDYNKTLTFPFNGMTEFNYIYQLKDGSAIIVYPGVAGMIGYNSNRFSGGYTESIGTILYDINGLSGNNVLGKEVFAFLVDDKGLLMPVGSNTHRKMAHTNVGMDLECNTNKMNYGLLNDLFCSGKIADNGWKADY